jgi:periplasmic divalent cation tolerance protein
MVDASGEVLLVLSTVPDLEVGERLVRQLVEERLIACGNLAPGLLSIFRWEGALCREAEVLVIMKTTRARHEELFRRISELHPYEVPEVLALPVQAGLQAYCAWVAGATNEVNG